MNRTAKHTVRASGGCLCGAVRYEIHGPLRHVVACHCGLCRRSHGHFAAYSETKTDHLRLTAGRGLKWFDSSPKARRGFCAECGSRLFWQLRGGDTMNVAAGSIDAPTGLVLVGHVFTAEIPDYYQLTDELPKFLASSKGAFNGEIS